MDLKNTYLGFTDNMNPMQKARAEKTLDKLIRSNGKIMTQKEWVIGKVLENHTPAIEENYTTWNKRTGEVTKPKTDYRLVCPDNTFYQITKTEYEFAQYILENDLTDETKINEYVTIERNRIEENNRLKAEQEAKERAEREAKKMQEEQERQARKEAREQMIQTAYNNITAKEWEAIKRIVERIREKYTDILPNVRVDRDSIAKVVIYDRLWPEATLSNIKYYKELTVPNSKSPNVSNEWLIRREEMIKDIREMFFGIDYNMPSQTIRDVITGKITAEEAHNRMKKNEQRKLAQEAKLTTFYRYISGQGFVEAKGDRIVVEGIITYGMPYQGGYILIEERSGCQIAKGKNKSEAKTIAVKSIQQYGIEKVENLITNMVNRNGISPLLKITQ